MTRKYMQGDFWSKVDKQEGGCWIWFAGKTSAGYGLAAVDGKRIYAHVYSYNKLVGPIPDGMELDHKCRNHACVNPEHLEPVTHQENILRGVSPAALRKVKTHCINGHLFDENNTYVYSDGTRHCRTCHREQERLHKLKSREV